MTTPHVDDSTDAALPVVDLNDALVHDLTATVAAHLDGVSPDELQGQVRIALDELAPVRVTAYLGVLIERRLRATMPRQRHDQLSA